MKYLGPFGVGGGTIYIGKGVIVGTDVYGGKYDGEYTEQNGHMKGHVKMTAPPGGMTLVTGQYAADGTTFDLNFDLPLTSFDDGTPQRMLGVGNVPIEVTFEKIREAPSQ
jgi:hypothetical protein